MTALPAWLPGHSYVVVGYMRGTWICLNSMLSGWPRKTVENVGKKCFPGKFITLKPKSGKLFHGLEPLLITMQTSLRLDFSLQKLFNLIPSDNYSIWDNIIISLIFPDGILKRSDWVVPTLTFSAHAWYVPIQQLCYFQQSHPENWNIYLPLCDNIMMIANGYPPLFRSERKEEKEAAMRKRFRSNLLCRYLTEQLAIWEPPSSSMDEFYLAENYRATYFCVLIFRNVLSGTSSLARYFQFFVSEMRG